MKYKIGVVLICTAVVGFTGKSDKPSVHGGIMVNSCTFRTKPELGKESKDSRANAEPWTSAQLLAPADLAAVISDPKAKKPIIICVGPGALIKGSLDMGPAKEKENLEKLKHTLEKFPKDANIVIYCGCCPFEHCPNIRPAFTLLNEMKFTNPHLLNLEHNIKTDWMAKGYPQ